MRRIISIVVVVVAIAGITIGGYLLWDQVTRVSTVELEFIVERDIRSGIDA